MYNTVARVPQYQCSANIRLPLITLKKGGTQIRTGANASKTPKNAHKHGLTDTKQGYPGNRSIRTVFWNAQMPVLVLWRDGLIPVRFLERLLAPLPNADGRKGQLGQSVGASGGSDIKHYHPLGINRRQNTASTIPVLALKITWVLDCLMRIRKRGLRVTMHPYRSGSILPVNGTVE